MMGCQPLATALQLTVLALAALCALGGAADAQAAQPSGLCPAAGTVVTVQPQGGASYKYTELGADPADPMVCVRTDSKGKTRKQFAHAYLIEWVKNPDVVRREMSAFFTGQKQEVDFIEHYVYPNSPQIPRSSEDRWKWTGKDTVSVGGRSIPVWVGTASSDGRAGANFSRSARFAYDPASKLILSWDDKVTMPMFSETRWHVIDFAPR